MLPMKFSAARLQQAVRLAGQVVPLGLFLADRQQADARTLDAERQPRVHGAHHRELHQVPGPARDVRPDVEQHGRRPRASARSPPAPAARRPRACPNAACAAMTVAPVLPGAEQRRRAPGRDLGGRHPDRRPRPLPQRRRRRLAHADRLVGRHHHDVERRRRPDDSASSSRRRSSRPTSDSDTPDSRAASSAPSTMVSGPRSPPIASTAIRIIGRVARPGRRLPFLDLAHLPAAVEAAVRAHLVRAASARGTAGIRPARPA